MRPFFSAALFSVWVGALVTSVTPASATTMMQLDLPALTSRAELVVAGKVTDSRAAWTNDHERIYTDVTIQVTRVLAGKATVGQPVVVRREGGSVDGIGMKVYGAAAFEKDEEVVVFLERRGASLYVVGMAQGKMELVADVAGVRHLRRDLSEVAFTAPRTAPERAIDTLDDLAAAVARLKARGKR
jgi:hypothetical protein